MDPHEDLKQLLDKFKKGTCTEAELDRLTVWFEKIGEEQTAKSLSEREVDAMYGRFKKTRRLRDRFHKSGNRIKRFRTVSIAASLLILLSVGIHIATTNRSFDTEEASKMTILSETYPGTNGAKVILENGEQVSLAHADEGFTYPMEGLQLTKLANGDFHYQQVDAAAPTKQLTIETPRAAQLTLYLPDGSKVWMNAGSKLSFPSDMSVSERTVHMEGEIYFEIAHQEGRAFTVASNEGQITVLGTKFNVRAYRDEPMTTALLEGSIAIASPIATRTLSPNQVVTINHGGDMKVETAGQVRNHIAWTQGFFLFEGADLYDIANEIGRWYDIDVHVKKGVNNKSIKGKIARDLKLAQLMEILTYLGVSCSIHDNQFIIQ